MGSNRLGLDRIRQIGENNLRRRLTAGMVLLITGIMTAVASFYLVETRRTIEDATQARALAFSRTFAMMGGAAILDNLFRIQDALHRYADDPDILSLQVVDPDRMIIAASDPSLIGESLADNSLQEALRGRQELMTHDTAHDGTPTLLVIEPLWNGFGAYMRTRPLAVVP